MGSKSSVRCALELASEMDRKVTVVEMLPQCGKDVFFINQITLFRKLEESGVTLMTDTNMEPEAGQPAGGEKSFCGLQFILSVFQTAYWHNVYSVRSPPGVIPDAGQNHQEGGIFHFCCINFIPQFFQVGRAFFYQTVSAKFYFN